MISDSKIQKRKIQEKGGSKIARAGESAAPFCVLEVIRKLLHPAYYTSKARPETRTSIDMLR